MNLENILAENMRRFGTKNLSEQSHIRLQQLSEQWLKFRWGKKRYSWGKQIKQGGETSIPFKNYDENRDMPSRESYDAYIQDNEKRFLKKLHPSSLPNWNELKQDEEHKGYAVAALMEFNKTYDTYKWKHAFCDTEDRIEQIIERKPKSSTETGSIDFNGISAPTLEFPVQGMGSNFFRDNLYEPTAEFVDAVTNDIINPLLEKAKEMDSHPKTQLATKEFPKFHLDELRIVTSCSRFRNTGNAKNMTFLELAAARANAAKNYILKRLSELGEGMVIVDEASDIQVEYTGENGDGSTGPNPPADNMVPIPGKECGKETAVYNPTMNKNELNKHRRNYGYPHTDKSAYDEYKYCRASIGLSANLAWLTTPDKIPYGDDEPDFEIIVLDIPTKDYGIFFYSPSKWIGISFRLPVIKFNIPKMQKPRWFRRFKNWLTPTRKVKRKIDCFDNW